MASDSSAELAVPIDAGNASPAVIQGVTAPCGSHEPVH